METRVTTEEMKRRVRKDMSENGVCFVFAGKGRLRQVREEEQKPGCMSSRVFSSEWSFVNLSSIHRHAFYNVP